MKQLLLLFAVLGMLVTSCDPKPMRSNFNIYPLSPFNDVTVFKNHDIGQDVLTGFKTQYYIVNESMDYTQKSKNRLQNFIEIKLRHDFKTAKAIYFTFYKGGFIFNRNSVQTKEELIKQHVEDKIAEFEYVNGKLFNFDFYKHGEYFELPPDKR